MDLFLWEVTGRNIFHLMVLTFVYITILMVIEYKSRWNSSVAAVYKSATSVWRGRTRNGTGSTGKNATELLPTDGRAVEMVTINPILDLDAIVGGGAATKQQPLPSPTVTLLQGMYQTSLPPQP